MSQQIKQAFSIPDIDTKTLQAWDRKYREEFNRKHGIDSFPAQSNCTDNEFRIAATKEKSLDPYYDPNSPDNSLMEQAKVFEANPAVDAYMRRKWGLRPVMHYGKN